MEDRERDAAQNTQLQRVETFGYDITPELQAEFAKLMRDVRELRDPSRNWFGLELIKQLDRGEPELTAEQREKILIVSCDNGSDGVGDFTGIDCFSLSPNAQGFASLADESLVDDGRRRELPQDQLLQDILDDQNVFQLTADTLRMLQRKEAILFVGESHDGSQIFKFESFLNNDLMRHLIDQKYTFFALGIWRDGQERVVFDSLQTEPCVKDVHPVGQDFWSPHG